MDNFKTNDCYVIEVDISETTSESYKEISGITDVDPQNNEVLDQKQYIGKGGHGATEITAFQFIFGVSGDRDYDDDGQNFIYGLQWKRGSERKKKVRITYPNGDCITGLATIVNIGGPGGSASQPGTFSCEFHFNEIPTLTDLSSVSGVSITSGDISVAPGVSSQITYELTPLVPSNNKVSFVSSNTGIAIVNSSGLVVGLSDGVAVITIITNDGGYTDSVNCTVSS